MKCYIVRRRYGRMIERPWDLVVVDDAVDPATEQSTGYHATFDEAFNAATRRRAARDRDAGAVR